MVIYTDSTKQMIMWELTVPWEENMEEAHERKHTKYLELVELSGTAKRGTVQAATDGAEKATRWLWIKRAWLVVTRMQART